jgi:NTP pyrophosphatase (non-canonical NTP hydrolase)
MMVGSHMVGFHRSLQTEVAELQKRVFDNNVAHGFWEDDDRIIGLSKDGELSIKSKKLMLIVSELAEVMEGLRAGNPPDEKCPEFTNEAIEMADAVIRILDYCERFNVPLVDAILAKHQFNVSRPYKHGKKF